MDIEFPALPAYEAAWAPIVWTPTLGSEEKLLIGLVGKFNNHFFAKRVVPDSTLGILYKSKKKNAIDILDTTIRLLNSQKEERIEDVEFPFTGFQLGEVNETFCDDEDDLIDQAIKFSFSLTTPEEYFQWRERENLSRVQSNRRRFISAVKRQVTRARKELRGCFEVQHQFNDYSINYDFFSDRLVSQLGVIRENTASEDTGTLRRLILDLCDAQSFNNHRVLLIQEDFSSQKERSKALNAVDSMSMKYDIEMRVVKEINEASSFVLDAS